VDYPPGRKVYEKGSYSIWEVEGTKEKVSLKIRFRVEAGTDEKCLGFSFVDSTEKQLYCQNLSLFGKFFIDHKVGHPTVPGQFLPDEKGLLI
jgi:hypothetical protein